MRSWAEFDLKKQAGPLYLTRPYRGVQVSLLLSLT
jgi:hypothetical protein